MFPRLQKKRLPIAKGRWCVLGSAAYVALWTAAMLLSSALGSGGGRSWLSIYGGAGLFLIGLGWTVWAVERASQYYRERRRSRGGRIVDSLPHPSLPRTAAAANDAGMPPEVGGIRNQAARLLAMLAKAMMGRRHAAAGASERIWNPLDEEAWYYGRSNPKLNQSITVLLVYTLVFFLLAALIGWLWMRRDIYELPAGGGQAKALAQTIRVQKIIRTKYVVNPFSAIKFEVPPIDEIKLRLDEATEHAYTVGYGEGRGTPGFGAGTARGKVRFIRLQYSGGNWDQKFGIGADLNMLLEYGIRTGQKVADQTESRTISELRGFPVKKSPPLVYLTGERNIVLTKAEIRTLREYLLNRRGMLFGDNGGSAQFHHQFLAMMAAVLPEVRPVSVPLDDIIHRVPYHIPFLPYVAPHGGKHALGWWVDGRWVCYYHPGDIGDAWCDGHSGVPSEIWECCYQLGTNVIFYAHVEYAKWLDSQKTTR